MKNSTFIIALAALLIGQELSSCNKGISHNVPISGDSSTIFLLKSILKEGDNYKTENFKYYDSLNKPLERSIGYDGVGSTALTKFEYDDMQRLNKISKRTYDASGLGGLEDSLLVKYDNQNRITSLLNVNGRTDGVQGCTYTYSGDTLKIYYRDATIFGDFDRDIWIDLIYNNLGNLSMATTRVYEQSAGITFVDTIKYQAYDDKPNFRAFNSKIFPIGSSTLFLSDIVPIPVPKNNPLKAITISGAEGAAHDTLEVEHKYEYNSQGMAIKEEQILKNDTTYIYTYSYYEKKINN